MIFEKVNLKNWFVGFVGMILLMGFVSAYGGYYGASSPADILKNEWVVFGILFLMIFAFVYMSLASFFTKKSEDPNFPWKKSKSIAKGPVTIISVCIALLFSGAIMRTDSFTNYLGETVTGLIILLFFVAVLFGLIASFFYMRKKIGRGAGIVVLIALIVLWFVFNSVYLYDILPYSVASSFVEEVYFWFTSGWGLILSIVIGVLMIIFGGKPESS